MTETTKPLSKQEREVLAEIASWNDDGLECAAPLDADILAKLGAAGLIEVEPFAPSSTVLMATITPAGRQALEDRA